MARQRQPNARAKVTGADIKNPQRYRNRSNPATQPLGDPPAYLSKDAKAEWRTLAGEIPWLCRSDRQMVALTATLAAHIQKHPETPVAYYAEHRRQLCALGGSPADRSKINVPDDDEQDPAAEFIN